MNDLLMLIYIYVFFILLVFFLFVFVALRWVRNSCRKKSKYTIETLPNTKTDRKVTDSRTVVAMAKNKNKEKKLAHECWITSTTTTTMNRSCPNSKKTFLLDEKKRSENRRRNKAISRSKERSAPQQHQKKPKPKWICLKDVKYIIIMIRKGWN